MNVNPDLQIPLQLTIEGGKWVLEQTLAPALRAMGNDIRAAYIAYTERNTRKVVLEAKVKNPELGVSQSPNPQVLVEICQRAALVEDETLQKAWAGLLASAATEDGKETTNIMYTNILGQLTPRQAKIVEFAATKLVKNLKMVQIHFVRGDKSIEPIDLLLKFIGEEAVPGDLQPDFDYLNSMQLLMGGFSSGSGYSYIEMSPTALALQFYLRCQGSREYAIDYFRRVTSHQ